MRHPATRAIYDYWNGLRGQRIAPRRLEVRPDKLGQLLLDCFILELDGDQAHFRLVGTRVSQRFAASLKAADFLGCWKEADQGLIAHHLASARELGRVTLFTGEADTAPSAPNTGAGVALPARGAFELIVLPLVHSGHAIDRLLCHLVPLDGAESASGSPIAGLKLMASETIWPDKEEATYEHLTDGPLALHPRVRTARIVRQGRRQFRVYEGGLACAVAEKV